MEKRYIYLFTVIFVCCVNYGTCDCVNAQTSEGNVTMKEGQMACATLQSGETQVDKGKRFVTCTNGNMHVQSCAPGTRFDTNSGICNWPDLATCRLATINTETSSTSQRSTDSTVTTVPSSKETSSPQSTAAPPVGQCNDNNCKLPDCFCYGNIPTSIPRTDMPQFIMPTFDDYVSTQWYNAYFKSLAVENSYNLYNPSGRIPKFTFFINDDNTDYTAIKAICSANNEISSHTLAHNLPQGDKDSDYPEMERVIVEVRNRLLRATGNKTCADSITGFRAPYLRVAGNCMYDVLHNNGFKYDSSILNINLLQGRLPYWPYTLDFIIQECISPPCPTKRYAGMWEVPLNGWIGDNQQGCSMPDDCVVGNGNRGATEQQWYDYYKRNFETYFYPVRVPMPFFVHGTLFDNFPKSYTAMIRWFQDLQRNYTNVWLVSPGQVIKWMQNQISNTDMIAQKWE